MATYKFTVVETVAEEYEYEVEAEDEREATRKAEEGDVSRSTRTDVFDVLERMIWKGPDRAD